MYRIVYAFLSTLKLAWAPYIFHNLKSAYTCISVRKVSLWGIDQAFNAVTHIYNQVDARLKPFLPLHLAEHNAFECQKYAPEIT